MSLKSKIQEKFEQYKNDGVNENLVDVIMGDVTTLLDEATKQIQELFDDTDKRAGDYRVISVVRTLKEEVLAVLGVDGKEKAKPT
jgi:predicted house-cleaning noncanonical NTP pyrophosphatase (MazG superfamily)